MPFLILSRRQLFCLQFHEVLSPDLARVDYWEIRPDNRVRLMNSGGKTIGWALVEDGRVTKVTEDRFREELEAKVLPAIKTAKANL